MVQDPIIETESLTKRFGKVVAVENLSLLVEEGEAFGFLGPNGAGKTTTIKMLTGFMRPTRGTVKVMGKDMFREPKEAKLRFGLVPDHFGFYGDLTAADHLDFYGALFGLPRRRRKEHIIDVLEQVGLGDRADVKTKGFSHGMQQRLVIAQALINEPKLLFLDEPTTGLDPRGSYEVREIVKDLASKGLTIFISSHLLWEVQDLCTKVGIIDKGHMLRMDTIENLGDELSERSGIQVHMDTTSVPDGALDSICKMKGVLNVSTGQGFVRVKVRDHSISPEVPAEFTRLGGRFRTCYEVVPNLEQIFLELTEGGRMDGEGGHGSAMGKPRPWERTGNVKETCAAPTDDTKEGRMGGPGRERGNEDHNSGTDTNIAGDRDTDGGGRG